MRKCFFIADACKCLRFKNKNVKDNFSNWIYIKLISVLGITVRVKREIQIKDKGMKSKFTRTEFPPETDFDDNIMMMSIMRTENKVVKSFT